MCCAMQNACKMDQLEKNEFRRKVFWEDCWRDYSDITHLHGFKELSLSSYKAEKIFWLIIILGAFVFTGFLIYKSWEDSLEDKKQTFIKYDKYGNISLPLLYCPSTWIDLNKIQSANISEHYVFYALSYLRSLTPTYVDEYFFGNLYDVDINSDLFCNANDKNEQLPALVYLTPFIERKCLSGKLPDYYGNMSRTVIKLLSNITKVIDVTNVHLMESIFEQCQQQNSSEVWNIVYNQFYLSTASEDILINKLGLEEKLVQKIDKCRKSKYNIILTLRDIDNFNNDSHVICSTLHTKSVVSESRSENNLCSMYNDAVMFYMFHGDALRSYICNDCEKYVNLEKRRSALLVNIISTDINYSKHLIRNKLKPSFETFKKYINEEIAGSNLNQVAAVLAIKKHAEEKFKKNEKDDFDEFLKQRNSTIFDIFRKISFDESKFLLGMSVDPFIEIRPKTGEIKIEKVINSYGLCYFFEVNADTTPVTDLPTSLITKINRRRKINEKLYVNIIELHENNGYRVRRDDNIFVIGSDTRMLIPSRDSFDISTNKDWRQRYYSFQVSNLVYQPRPAFTNCRNNVKNAHNITYSYCNCIANCFNIYDQPKYIDAVAQKKVECQYIAESTFENASYEYCSWFSAFNIEYTTGRYQQVLDECNQNCLLGCEVLNFDIISSEPNCLNDRHTCVGAHRPPNVRNDEFEKSLLSTYYINLPVNGTTSSRPIWMKPFENGQTTTITITDMITGIATVSTRAIARMEIQIDADVSYYTTHESMEWYGYLGVVGGQINLIVSGSLLTVFQMIWWCYRYFYKKRKTSSQRQSMNESLFITSRFNS